MRLPCVQGTLSSATKLKWSNIDQNLAELLEQASVSDDFSDLSNWTEVDSSGTNISVSGGIVSMNGSNAWAANGIWRSLSRAEGYAEIKFSLPTSIANNIIFALYNSTGLPNGGAQAGEYDFLLGSVAITAQQPSISMAASSFSTATFYTLRIYVKKSSDNTYKKITWTIQGGSFTSETVIACVDRTSGAEIASTFYVSIQRYVNSSANPASIKEFRWYSGYATDGPYIEYVHDAGSGKIFDNFDPTGLAIQGTIPTTNLKFAYSFDDGTEDWSNYLTLAQINAVSKITARRRYIRLRTQLNSDGATLVQGVKLNSDTAIDGIGDFPNVENVLALDTVQTATGTATVPNASNVLSGTGTYGAGGTAITPTSDKIYSAAEEAARNSLNGSTAADILLGSSVKVLNVTVNGTAIEETHTADEVVKSAGGNWNDDNLQIGNEDNVKLDVAFGLSQTGTLSSGGGTAPAAPLGVDVYALGPSSLRVVWDFTAGAETFDVYRLNGLTWVKVGADVEGESFDNTGLTAETEYSYKVIAKNEAGSSSYSAVASGTTKAETGVIERIHNAIIQLISGKDENGDAVPGFGMRAADGYWFDWNTADIDNDDKVEIEAGEVWCNVKLDSGFENNFDQIDTTDPNSMSNEVKYRIEIWMALEQLAERPMHAYIRKFGQAIEDIKKVFCSNYGLLPGTGVEQIMYTGAEQEPTITGDVVTLGKLTTMWSVRYVQDRLEPNTTY